MQLTPQQTDYLWAACELGATVFQIVNIKIMIRDRGYAGIHWGQTAFYIGWGILNIPAYWTLHQVHAMAAGILMTFANVAWIAMALHFGPVKALPSITAEQLRAARLLFGAAEDARMTLEAIPRNILSFNISFAAGQAITNLRHGLQRAKAAELTRADTMDGDLSAPAS